MVGDVEEFMAVEGGQDNASYEDVSQTVLMTRAQAGDFYLDE